MTTYSINSSPVTRIDNSETLLSGRTVTHETKLSGKILWSTLENKTKQNNEEQYVNKYSSVPVGLRAMWLQYMGSTHENGV